MFHKSIFTLIEIVFLLNIPNNYYQRVSGESEILSNSKGIVIWPIELSAQNLFVSGKESLGHKKSPWL